MNNDAWPLVSVLFITYKRCDLLEQSICAFRENTDYPNLEIVIADDGSGAEIQKQIQTLPANVFALAPKNRGLGANNNNGLKHCSGKYILMIQDDCMCRGPRYYLKNTIQVMEANLDIGIINYCGAPHPLDTSRPLPGSDEPCYPILRPYDNGTIEHHLYTDQPHVRSRAAQELMGEYAETPGIGNCEEEYSMRWRDQKKFGTAVFPNYYKTLYVHEGSERSFRYQIFSLRVDAFLMPVAMILKRRCMPLFKVGKKVVRTSVGIMEKLRIVH